MSDWKKRLGVVFSTNPNFDYNNEEEVEEETIPNEQQRVVVSIDRRNRGGKQVTLIKGFRGSEAALNQLAKLVKSRCGSGGSAKEGEIIIQGDFRAKIKSILESEGYGVKLGN